MPTPTQRLEERKRIAECRVCAWLITLTESEQKEWQKAIADRRFSADMVANEIMAEISSVHPEVATYTGPTIGESSVETHRTRGHR